MRTDLEEGLKALAALIDRDRIPEAREVFAVVTSEIKYLLDVKREARKAVDRYDDEYDIRIDALRALLDQRPGTSAAWRGAAHVPQEFPHRGF